MTSLRTLVVGAATLGAAAVMGLASLPARAAEVTPLAAPAVSVAIVVGSNHSPSATQPDLKYGDDDAVQNARTLALLGADTTLLVSPDAETRELFPRAKPVGGATRAALRAAFGAAKAKLAAARAAGRPTDLYFLFAGHGDLADGRPFLQLDDARLWREDLAEWLRDAGADENHVVVDACYAAAFVSSRGPGGERETLPAGFSQGTRAAWPAHTGFLTARSSGGQTHEWAQYQAGVFSHELRSGLMGAADVDVDGKITYREIAAFVRRANEAIPNRRFRPELSTTPPDGNLDAALARLPEGPIVLELDVQPAGRAFVETEKGIRLADLHAGSGKAIRLRLPADMGNLFVEQESTPNLPSSTREYRLQPGVNAGLVRQSTLALASDSTRVSTRGAGHEAFMHLFARPFDGDAAASFSLDAETAADLKWQKDSEDLERRRTTRQRVALGLWGTSVATAAVGAGFFWSAHHAGDDATSGDALAAANAKRHRYNLVGGTLVGVAGASAITGAILWLWPDAPPVTVASTPSCEACLTYTGAF